MSVGRALQQGDNGAEVNLHTFLKLVLRRGKWSVSYSNDINSRQSFCGGDGSGRAPEPVSKGAGWEVSLCEIASCLGRSLFVS